MGRRGKRAVKQRRQPTPNAISVMSVLPVVPAAPCPLTGRPRFQLINFINGTAITVRGPHPPAVNAEKIKVIRGTS